jgi:23S rRNA pseudouridine1911/1915/1917 synthase
LHAKYLEIEHPATKKIMKFESDLPDDMRNLLDKWRKYSQHKALEEESESE